MNITVAICTWNRADLLTKTLDNMLRLKSDGSFFWELIIVNNNCTDNTDDVIAQFSDSLPIKRISEPTPGLSNARNAAVRNASGDYIVWTDDDVLVDENWLVAYAGAFRKYPEAAVFGGPVEPWFEGEPPGWLTKGWKYIATSYAVRDLGDLEFPFESQKTSSFPYGANFAIKMSAQEQYKYDPELGLKAGKIILGEETVMMQSIFSEGYSGWWIPSARVKHWLPKTRQSLGYIKRYYEGQGRTKSKSEDIVKCARIFGYPRWMLRKLFPEIFLCCLLAIIQNEKWLEKYVEIYRVLGSMRESKLLAKNK